MRNFAGCNGYSKKGSFQAHFNIKICFIIIFRNLNATLSLQLNLGITDNLVCSKGQYKKETDSYHVSFLKQNKCILVMLYKLVLLAMKKVYIFLTLRRRPHFKSFKVRIYASIDLF